MVQRLLTFEEFMYSCTEKQKLTKCFHSKHTHIFTTAFPTVGKAIFYRKQSNSGKKMVLICTFWNTGKITHQVSGLLFIYVFFCEIPVQVFSHLYTGAAVLFWLRDFFLQTMNFSFSHILQLGFVFFFSQLIPGHLNLPNIYYKDGLNFFSQTHLFPI